MIYTYIPELDEKAPKKLQQQSKTTTKDHRSKNRQKEAQMTNTQPRDEEGIGRPQLLHHQYHTFNPTLN